MKKLFLSMAILFAMGIVFTACGDDASGEKKLSEICECAELQLNMMKDMKDGIDMEALEKKYESKSKKCEEMGKGKSDEELEKMKKELDACPAAKELEKMESDYR